jgi:hypothetical protein
MKIDFKNPAHVGMCHTILFVISVNLWVATHDWLFAIPTILGCIAIVICLLLCHYPRKKL